uniref:BRCT domain-containing protein n=2 Tax=Caenorhabditis japonica TaxID=281687 RepID=A0A8R1ILF9_CAEJA
MNPYFDYKQLIDLVKLCGGEILSCYDNLSPEKLFIIFSKHSKSIDESRNMEKVYKCEVVTIEWVLDSISEYTILPTDEYKAVKLANSILEE